MRFVLALIIPLFCLSSAGMASSGNGEPSRAERERMEIVAKQQLLFLDPEEQSYEELAKLDPAKYYNLERLIEKGKVYLRKGEKDQGNIELHRALVLLNKQIKIHKYDRHYYSLRTQVNRELGRIGRAIKDMEMVVELTPDDAAPMVKMGNFVRLENLRQLQGTEVDISDTLEPDEEYGEEPKNAPERAGKPGNVMIGNL